MAVGITRWPYPFLPRQLTIISSLELANYGVRTNAVAPGGMTRMSGSIVKDMELKEPEQYDEFNAMNPGNSAPTVVWLASDQALHVTGQVFRAGGVGGGALSRSPLPGLSRAGGRGGSA